MDYRRTNRPKMVKKWTKNVLKMNQKWTKNGLKWKNLDLNKYRLSKGQIGEKMPEK